MTFRKGVGTGRPVVSRVIRVVDEPAIGRGPDRGEKRVVPMLGTKFA
ncbi:MAG: hypothetical protein QOF33_3142 [Thermomicrobiales bacterium]|nr:hypothetical protein [Thermomicrobiales bacterium]